MPEIVHIGEFHVERHYLRFVESELKRHPHRKRRLRDLEDDIIRATPEEDLTGMPKGSTPGNPTLNKAISLMRSEERAHLSMMVRRVEDTFTRLSPLQQDIIRLLYFDGRFTLEGVIEKVHCPRRTFFRQRNGALLAFTLTLVGDHACGTNMAP